MTSNDVAAKVMEYLKTNAPEIADAMVKSMPVGDVHAATALGNQKGSKKVSFADALDDEKKKKKVGKMIREEGGKYTVYSHDGSKKLGTYGSKGEAEKRLAEVEAFKRDTAQVDYLLPIVVTKVDPDQRKVFGWAYICERDGSLIVDKQGDSILPEDMEKAAHLFALESRSHGEMHELDFGGTPIRKGDLIENMMFTKERLAKGISAVDPVTGEQLFGWFVGFKVDDDNTWSQIKAGLLPEFSIGGRGRRVET